MTSPRALRISMARDIRAMSSADFLADQQLHVSSVNHCLCLRQPSLAQLNAVFVPEQSMLLATFRR